MRISRVWTGEWATGLAAALLLASLFMPWFGGESAFEATSFTGPFLAVVAGLGLLVPPLVASQRKTDLPVVYETLVAIAALAGTVVVLVRVLSPLEGGADAGLFVALAAVLALLAGSWRSMGRGN